MVIQATSVRNEISIGACAYFSGVVIGVRVPIRRTRRDNEGTRGYHVRLEPPHIAFDSHAHIAAARESAHFIRRIGERRPRCVRRWRIHRDINHLVGDVAHLLHGTHRDHVLGRCRRQNRVRHAALAAVVHPPHVLIERSGVARGEHIQDRIGAGDFRNGIAHGRIVAGRRQVVVVYRVVPTVVENGNVAADRHSLQIRIRHGEVGHKEVRGRRLPTKHVVAGRVRQHGSLGVRDGAGHCAIANHDTGDVCSMPEGVSVEPREIRIVMDPVCVVGMPAHTVISKPDHHVRASQPEVVGFVAGILSHSHGDSAEVIRQNALPRDFDHLHPAQACQCDHRVLLRQHPYLRAERMGLRLAQNPGARRLDLGHGGFTLISE